MKSMSRRRTFAGLAIVAIAAMGLTGCAAGDAATFGSSTISQSTLESIVSEVNVGRGTAATTPDRDLVVQVLNRLMAEKIIAALGEEQHVTITQTQIDEQIASAEATNGGKEGLEKLLLNNGIPWSRVQNTFRTQLTLQASAVALDPNGDSTSQQQAVVEALVRISTSTNASINPQYGTWKPEDLQLGGLPNDLSTPHPNPTADPA